MLILMFRYLHLVKLMNREKNRDLDVIKILPNGKIHYAYRWNNDYFYL